MILISGSEEGELFDSVKTSQRCCFVCTNPSFDLGLESDTWRERGAFIPLEI